MEKHIKVVGILNIICHSVTILAALIILAIAVAFGWFIGFAMEVSQENIMEIPKIVAIMIPLIFVSIGIVLLIFSAVGIIGAIGVLKRKEWGRITLLIVSFFDLLKFPLGTALGIYNIWVLLSDETIKLFTPITKKNQ